MAVTRRMARQKAANNKKLQKNSAKNKLKDCIVRIRRLTEADIFAATNSASTSVDNDNEKHYSLRQKKAKPETKTIEHKPKPSLALVKSVSSSYNSLWNMAKKNRSLPQANTIVLAKMKSFSPWPSKLVSINGVKAFVYFFGTNNHGTVLFKEVVPFNETSSVIRILATMKIQHFKKAIREAEIFIGIPSELSILNEIF